MSSHYFSKMAGDALSGASLIQKPRPGETLKLGGQHLVTCRGFGSGTYAFPDVDDAHVGTIVFFIADGDVTLTNKDGEAFCTLSAGEWALCSATSTTQWSATSGVGADPEVVPEFTLGIGGDGNYHIGTPELQEYLANLRTIVTEPQIVTNGQRVTSDGGWSDPIGVDPSMCDTEVALDVDEFSPHAVYQDAYHKLQVQANGGLSLSEPSSTTGTLTVDEIDRDLPEGFVLGFGPEFSEECVELTADCPEGSTALPVRVTNMTGGSDSVTISDNEIGVPFNRFTSQGGVNQVQWIDRLIWGNPTNPMLETAASNASRGMACDGIVVGGTGALVQNCIVGNLPGVGLWVQRKGNTSTRKGRHTPQESQATQIKGFQAFMTHFGAVFDASDTEVTELLLAEASTYFGSWFRANSVTTCTGSIHSYGVKGATTGGGQAYDATAIRVEGILRSSRMEGEASYNGIDFLAGSSDSEVAILRCYSNTNNCCRVFSGDNYFGSMRLTHAVANKPCLLIGDSASGNTFNRVHCETSNNARGLQLGQDVNNTITDTYLNRFRVIGGGSIGVYVATAMLRGFYNIELMGDATAEAATPGSSWSNKAVYFDTTADFDHVEMHFLGPSASTIKWPDLTTGTFGTPNIPVAISSANDINFVTTD